MSFFNRVLEEETEKEVIEIVNLIRSLPDVAGDFVELQWRYRARFNSGNPADAQIHVDEKTFGRCFFHIHAKSQVCNLNSSNSNQKHR
jgi:hypothetical protein